MAELNHATKMRATSATIRAATNGNIGVLRDGVADLLDAVASIVETGYQTPGECAAFRAELKTHLTKPRFGWPAMLAVLAACSTVIGIVHMIKG